MLNLKYVLVVASLGLDQTIDLVYHLPIFRLCAFSGDFLVVRCLPVPDILYCYSSKFIGGFL